MLALNPAPLIEMSPVATSLKTALISNKTKFPPLACTSAKIMALKSATRVDITSWLASVSVYSSPSGTPTPMTEAGLLGSANVPSTAPAVNVIKSSLVAWRMGGMPQALKSGMVTSIITMALLPALKLMVSLLVAGGLLGSCPGKPPAL